MTFVTADRLTHVDLGDLMWEYASIDLPGHCDRFGWCDGDCTPLEPGRLGDMHSRYIASAMRTSGDLVEIGVGQWKADPAQTWRDGGSCMGYPNRDGQPKVGIFTYPEDLSETTRVFLKVPDAASLAAAVRVAGCDPLADALDAAVKFARALPDTISHAREEGDR